MTNLHWIATDTDIWQYLKLGSLLIYMLGLQYVKVSIERPSLQTNSSVLCHVRNKTLHTIGEGVGYIKTQLSCILLYYADDMFRQLWANFRSQKCIQRKTIQNVITVQLHILNFQRDLFVGWIIHIELKLLLLIRVFKNLMDIYWYRAYYLYITIQLNAPFVRLGIT